MSNDQSSLPTPVNASVHRLEGKALKQWWQWEVSHKAQIGSTNPIIIQHLIFLISLPFFAINAAFTVGLTPQLIFLSIAAWLSDFLLFLSIARRHLRHVLAVREYDDGLEVRSLFYKRKLRWLEIEDFFPIGHNEFMLDCKNGEEFLLSNDLTDSDKLFDLINNVKPRTAVSYELSYRIPDGFFYGGISAAFAVIIAVVFAVLCSGDCRTSLAALSIAAVLVVLAILFWWFNVYKIPQLIRTGSSGLYVRTLRQSKLISWDQITNITQISNAAFFIVKSHLGSFLIFSPKGESRITEKLLEYKSNLLLNRKSS